jgi:hypothetical protein
VNPPDAGRGDIGPDGASDRAAALPGRYAKYVNDPPGHSSSMYLSISEVTVSGTKLVKDRPETMTPRDCPVFRYSIRVSWILTRTPPSPRTGANASPGWSSRTFVCVVRESRICACAACSPRPGRYSRTTFRRTAAKRGFASTTSRVLPGASSGSRQRVTGPVPAPTSSTSRVCPARSMTDAASRRLLGATAHRHRRGQRYARMSSHRHEVFLDTRIVNVVKL